MFGVCNQKIVLHNPGPLESGFPGPISPGSLYILGSLYIHDICIYILHAGYLVHGLRLCSGHG
jgi:hypothetical protein